MEDFSHWLSDQDDRNHGLKKEFKVIMEFWEVFVPVYVLYVAVTVNILNFI